MKLFLFNEVLKNLIYSNYIPTKKSWLYNANIEQISNSKYVLI